MNEWRFQQSPGRAGDESAGRARKGPGASQYTGPCTQAVWWCGVNAAYIEGGWRPFAWDPFNPTPPTVLYRKAKVTVAYVDEVDPDSTQRARWETREYWITPRLGDVYKFVWTTDLDGVVHSWERGGDDSISETVAAGPFAALGVLEGRDSGAWAQTINTATTQRWQSSREQTGTYDTTSYPDLAGTIYQDQPLYTGDYRFDFNVANTYELWELSDSVDVSDTEALVTAAANIAALTDLSGSVTIATGPDANGNQPDLPYRIDTWGTASLDLTPGGATPQADKVFWRQWARTPAGLALTNSRLTGNSPSGLAAEQITPLILSSVHCRAGGSIGAKADAFFVSSGTQFYVSAAPSTAFATAGPTAFPTPINGTYGSGVFATASKVRIWMADNHCCAIQNKYKYPLSGETSDYTGPIGYYCFAGEETYGVITGCGQETHTEFAYDDRPENCRDEDPDCVAMEEKDAFEVDAENYVGYVEINCQWCADTCTVLQCATEGDP